jgi:hypothetical protein
LIGELVWFGFDLIVSDRRRRYEIYTSRSAVELQEEKCGIKKESSFEGERVERRVTG